MQWPSVCVSHNLPCFIDGYDKCFTSTLLIFSKCSLNFCPFFRSFLAIIVSAINIIRLCECPSKWYNSLGKRYQFYDSYTLHRYVVVWQRPRILGCVRLQFICGVFTSIRFPFVILTIAFYGRTFIYSHNYSINS